MELLMNMIIDLSMEENHWSNFSGLNQILCGRSMLYRHQIKNNHVSPSCAPCDNKILHLRPRLCL